MKCSKSGEKLWQQMAERTIGKSQTIHAYIRTHIHTYILYIPTLPILIEPAPRWAFIQVYIHIYTYIHTYIHTYINAYTIYLLPTLTHNFFLSPFRNTKTRESRWTKPETP